MPLVRILVDGYSLLHRWPELAPEKARYSAAAREELISILTQYRDAIGTPITIVFDGSQAGRIGKTVESTPELEILYSTGGRSADDLIERAAARFQAYGEILVVTDDFAERDTVFFHGAIASSCANFIDNVEDALHGQATVIAQHNKHERARFKTPR